MKNKLKLFAVVSLVCGVASAGFGLWSYFRSTTLADTSRELQGRSIELEDRSDTVKGTPQENTLVGEAQRLQQEASATLAGAKSNSQRAVILGGASIVLILASIGLMVAHVNQKESDRG